MPVARHLGEHIPGHPAVFVSNMPAAHGITSANFLFNTAPRDGTALGALLPYIAEYQVQGIEGIEYDAARFGWLGSIAPSNEVIYVWHTVPIYTVEDLKKPENDPGGLRPGRNVRAPLGRGAYETGENLHNLLHIHIRM